MSAITRSGLVSAALLVAPLWLGGCVDGDVTTRDDGKHITPANGTAESGLRETQVNERAAQLLRDHPGLSAKEAYRQARADDAATVNPAMRTRAELEKAEAQDKFEDELVKIGK